MSIVGGPPPSLARDVDAEPRTIAATTIAVALANIVEPFQDHPTALGILALGLSLQLSFRATWLATTRRAKWRSAPLPTRQALLRLSAPVQLPAGAHLCPVACPGIGLRRLALGGLPVALVPGLALRALLVSRVAWLGWHVPYPP